MQAGKENTWMREFIEELKIRDHTPPTIIYQDNKSAIALSVGGTNHKRSKHFGIEYNKLRENIEMKEIEIRYRPTDDLAADMLTKILPPNKFGRFRDEVMGDGRAQRELRG